TSVIATNPRLTGSRSAVATNPATIPPAPTPSGAIRAGIGSTIVVPVVVNLRTNDQVKSFQFRVEITPNGGAQPIAAGPSGFYWLNVGTNDFVLLAAANAPGTTGTVAIASYTIGTTTGLQSSALGT